MIDRIYYLPVRVGTYGSEVHEWVAANKESVEWSDLGLLKFLNIETYTMYRLKFGKYYDHPNYLLIK